MKKILLLLPLSFFLTLGYCKKEKTSSTETATENIPVAKEKIIEIKTDFGNMYLWLYKKTPLHRANFLGLADTNFFDNTTFHRIVPNFVIQGGDELSKDSNPNNDGQGGLYTVPAEIDSSLKHVYGAVGAARLGDNVNPTKSSNSSQFYFVVNTAGVHYLDNNYTVFGIVMKGMDVAVTIAGKPKSSGINRPITDIKMDVNILEKTLEEIKAEYDFTPPN